jgi:hypothetical protein
MRTSFRFSQQDWKIWLMLSMSICGSRWAISDGVGGAKSTEKEIMEMRMGDVPLFKIMGAGHRDD